MIRIRSSLLLLFGGCVAVLSTVGFLATSSAKHLAGDLPYCIQVPHDRGYAEIRYVFQLTPLWMRGSRWQHHAVLAVGSPEHPRVYHWSYFARKFVEDAHAPPIFCEPRSQFLMTPPPAGDDGDDIRFRLAGNAFRIPSAYRPEAFGGHSPYIILQARSPDFVPLAQGASTSDFIEVALSIQDRLQVWRSTPDEAHVVTSQADAHGLHAQSVSIVDRGKERPPSLEFFQAAEDGRVITIMLCQDSPSYLCLHSFESGGWTYTFNHPYSLLGDWRELQRRLVALVASFKGIPTDEGPSRGGAAARMTTRKT
jgi:hypothetical protein